ncbi:MAG: tripartite tricarboxylate transporter permease [Candidatus Anstonellaceae archaeon]
MLLEIAAGILLGAFSGLLPGVHANTIAAIVASLPIEDSSVFYILAAVVGAHLAFQFFPSIFLSIPDESVVVSALPGHRMALEGRGLEALYVCASSLLAAAALAALLFPLAAAFFPLVYGFVKPNAALILAATSVFLIATEKEIRKIAAAFFVFALTGAIGIATLEGQINDPLFAAFAGLFAASGILLSFGATKPLPEQKQANVPLDYHWYIAGGVVLGMLSDLLPGIAAPAQIAVFATAILSLQDPKKFLALTGSIAASHTIFAFAANVSIGKAREGTIAIINQIYPVGIEQVPSAIGIILLSLALSSIIVMRLGKGMASRLSSKKLGLLVLAYLVVAVGIICGWLGLVLFATCTAAGLLPPLLGIRRTHVMGLIILPSIFLS